MLPNRIARLRNIGDRSRAATGAPIINLANDPSGIYGPYNGSLAEYGVWQSVNLTADEIAALAKGVPPSRIRPSNLEVYVPLTRDVHDLKDRPVSAITGGTVVDHPRVIGGAV
jgi:hypothetical protein